jgi:hypothetical protein
MVFMTSLDLTAMRCASDRRHAPARLGPRAALLVPGGEAARNVQLLAAVARALVLLRGLARLLLALAALLLGRLAPRLLLGLAPRLLLGLPPRHLLGRASLGLLAFAPHGLALLDLAPQLLLGRLALRVLRLALAVDLLLRHPRLLLEHVALDVGALAAHLDADRARLAHRGRDPDLALRLAAQRDLARRAAVLRLAVRLAQVRQQLVLGVLTDAVLRSLDLDAGFLELREQPVHRHLEDLRELLDRHIGHRCHPPPAVRPGPRFRTSARGPP